MTILKRGLIVSCQATPEEPMHGSEIMARMAVAAQMGGAVGVRVNTYDDLCAVRNAVSIPILGIIKHKFPGYWPYMTPILSDVDLVVKSGAEIVCIDGTDLPHPEGNDIDKYVKMIREKYPRMEICCDVATLSQGIHAASLGVDYVATTLYGYTPDTIDTNSPVINELREPNIDLVEQLAKHIDVPIIAEGRYWDEINAIKGMKAGAYAVTIGAGITRPQIITKKIVDAINNEFHL